MSGRKPPLTRYVVHPGWVVSEDGDRHRISFDRLVRLYAVDPCMCVNADNPGHLPRVAGDVHLYPQPSGRYVLPGSS